ncbi:MAG: hypothetical protein AB7G11_01930 [Phycisphaerales bacterium]
MQLSKKDKALIGIAGVLLVVVVIVYALYYGGGGEQGDKPTAEGLAKPRANQVAPNR